MTAVIAALGGWLPPTRVPNSAFELDLETSDEWIYSRTGIRARRRVSEGMSTRDLAINAGQHALSSWGGNDVDCVIVATTSPDRLCPAVAPEVASALGMNDVGAFDIASACSGFVYGLATAAGLIAGGVSNSVLLIGAEAFSLFVDRRDRNTAPIFGDGAGAVILRSGTGDELGSLGPFDLGSDGTRADLLAIPSGGSRQRAQLDSSVGGELLDNSWFLQMEGRPIFVQAVRRMCESAARAIASAGWEIGDVDWIVGHQANLRILEAVASELKIDSERVASNIDQVGNTLAASIPLLLCDYAKSNRLQRGDRILLCAFGAGLSWGSTTVIWPGLNTNSLLEEEEVTYA